MSKHLYQNFVGLLKKWPVDEAKKGRNLGELIRKIVAHDFPKGGISTVPNPTECTKNLESLYRLANNKHSTKYPRLFSSTAMGLTPDISGKAISNKSIEEFSK